MSNEKSDYPLTNLYLYLTDSCNLRCGHCWIAPKLSLRPQGGIQLDTLQRTVLEAKALGLQSVKLTGGEPLLYRDLTALLQFLCSQNLGVCIETNGTLIHKDFIDTLKSCRVEQVSVSLDAGSADLHDEIRGMRGSFDRTLNGLRLLAEGGLDFQIIMTLQRKNCEEIPAIIRLSEELGAASLKINHLIPCGRARDYFERRDNLALQELIRLHRIVQEKWAETVKVEIIFDLPVAFQSIAEIKRRGVNACRVLNILGILANGDFSICGIGQTVDELRLGNIREVSIVEVWHNNALLNGLRESLPRKLWGVCAGCIFKFQCLGACRANAHAMTGDLYAPYFLCQELYESGRFPMSRYIG